VFTDWHHQTLERYTQGEANENKDKQAYDR